MNPDLSLNDRLFKLIKAFEIDNFAIDTIQIAFDNRIGIRARHNTAVNYNTKEPKKVYYVEGNHYQMGYLLGLLAEPDIERMAVDFVENVVLAFINNDTTPRFPILHKMLGEVLEHIIERLSKNMDAYIPQDFDNEMNGIIEGCVKANPRTQVNRRHLEILNTGVDILCSLIYTGDFLAKRLPDLEPYEFRLPAMCNGFAVFGAAAAGGHYLGRDFMFPTADVFQDTACMIIHNPIEAAGQIALPTVSVTSPGMIGSVTAMNINGVGAGVDISPAGNCSPDNIGVNSLLMTRCIIQYGCSAEYAVNIMTNLPRGVSWNYIIADGLNDRACVVEAGSSMVTPDFLAYPPEELIEQKLLPDQKFIDSHKSAEFKAGLMVRWNDYQYPKDYLKFNPQLWEFYNKGHSRSESKNLYPDAFSEKGFINREPGEQNCPAAYYFAPQRETRNDLVLVSNHFIIPEMRLFAMNRWATFIATMKADDIQWRYDQLNHEIMEAIAAKGLIDYETAKQLIDFLAPYGKFPEYYSNNPRSDDGEAIRIQGSVSLCDLKKKTIESHFGYYCDEWIKMTLPNYIFNLTT